MKKKLVKRPWGNFEQFALNEKSTIKIITMNPKQKFSLQLHKNREEFWKFIAGEAKVTIGNKIFKAKPGDEFFVKRGQLHRVEAISKPVKFIEIAFGKFDENDIKRIEDDYGRA